MIGGFSAKAGVSSIQQLQAELGVATNCGSCSETAAEILLRDNVLPGITGRVCPQETQCEEVCVRAKKGTSVAVGLQGGAVFGAIRYNSVRPSQIIAWKYRVNTGCFV